MKNIKFGYAMEQAMQWSNWRFYVYECFAISIMLIIGLGGCIYLLAPSSPVGRILESYPMVQNLLCGLVFGFAVTAGMVNPFGKMSGAHLNPSVSLAFLLMGRIRQRDFFGYFGAQLIGCLLSTGVLWLLGCVSSMWGVMAREAHYGGAYPGSDWNWETVFCAEFIATFGLVMIVFWCIAHPRFRNFAMWWPVFYFGIMNSFLGGVSGTSVNFVRSLGPALFAHDLGGLWIYLIAPFLGATVAVIAVRRNLVWTGKPEKIRSLSSIVDTRQMS